MNKLFEASLDVAGRDFDGWGGVAVVSVTVEQVERLHDRPFVILEFEIPAVDLTSQQARALALMLLQAADALERG